MSGPCLTCIIFLTSYLPRFNFLCVNITIIKGPSQITSPFGSSALCPTLGDKASPCEGGVGVLGSHPDSQQGGRSQGAGAAELASVWTGSLQKVPSCFASGFSLWWLLPRKQPAAFPWRCLGTSKPPFPPWNPWDLRLSFSRSSTQRGSKLSNASPVPGSFWKLYHLDSV